MQPLTAMCWTNYNTWKGKRTMTWIGGDSHHLFDWYKTPFLNTLLNHLASLCNKRKQWIKQVENEKPTFSNTILIECRCPTSPCKLYVPPLIHWAPSTDHCNLFDHKNTILFPRPRPTTPVFHELLIMYIATGCQWHLAPVDQARDFWISRRDGEQIPQLGGRCVGLL